MAQKITDWGGATKTTPASPSYPNGSAKNVSAPGAGDGTPWVAPFVNQLEGFFQRLMTEANLTYNGNVDTSTASQFYDAAAALFSQTTGWILAQQVTTNGANNYTVTGIPSTVNAVMVRYNGVNFATADRPILRLTNSGAPVTSGYQNSLAYWTGGAIARAGATTEVEPGRDNNVPGTDTHSGWIIIMRVGNLTQWNFASDSTLSNLNGWGHAIGFSPAIATMDGVQILSKSSNNFSGGTVAVYYM